MDKSELKQLIKGIETLELNDETRSTIDGDFISLPSGVTHYELKGEGEPVVLVHGYATPYYIYDKEFESLLSDGYKVLRYDLLGRGFSDRPEVDYTPELFAIQLRELTSELFGDTPFYLFGTSMGGIICSAFCTMFPDSVKKLVLLAPAGMDTFKPPFYMKLSAIPLLGDLMFRTIGGKTLLKRCASELKYSDGDAYDYYIRSFAAAAKYKGFLRCTLSSLRNTILKTEKDTRYYIAMAAHEIPTLVIWGTDDRTMPYYQQARMQEVLPHAEMVTFPDSGHIFLFDEGDRTMSYVSPFLKK